MSKSTKKQQYADNVVEKDLLMNKWQNIATSIFKWDNLPSGITEKNIEKLLYKGGSAVFINDSSLGYMVLDVAFTGQFNVNGEPIKWQAVGLNYNQPYTIDNSVLIQNNPTRTPTINYISYQIDKMIDIERTHTLNLNAQKTPMMFSGSEDELLTFKNILEQVVGGNLVVYMDKSLNGKPFEVHVPQVQYLAKDLHDDYNVYENRIKEYIGLDAISVDKKERLLKGEGDSNDEHINANLSVYLDERQLAVDKINKMFNLVIKLSINPLIFDETEEEEVNYGNVHNDARGSD